jgi:hypothetical protein
VAEGASITGSDRRIKHSISNINKLYEIFYDFIEPVTYKYKN